MSLAGENRAIARSAALIYAGAVVEGLVETAIPGGPEFWLLPGFAALAIAPLAALLGPRLSRRALSPRAARRRPDRLRGRLDAGRFRRGRDVHVADPLDRV